MPASPVQLARPVVITGVTGFLGRHLLASSSPVWRGGRIAIARRERRESHDLPAGVRLVTGDVNDGAFLDRTIPRGSAVVNLIYDFDGSPETNITLATSLAEACARAGVERLVHVSTAGVIGLSPERVITEASEPRPVTAYQHTKLEIERVIARIAANQFPLVILRPTSVFGPGGASLVSLTRHLRQRWRVVNYLRSSLSGRRAMNLVPVETVAAAIEFALESQRAVEERLYLVSEDAAPENNFRDVEQALQRGLGVKDYPVAPLPLPQFCLTTAQRLIGRLSLYPSTRFSAAKLARAGFRAPITFQQAIENYAERAAGGSDRP